MKKQFLIMTIIMMSSINLLVGTNSNPTMSRIYGNQYTPGIADTQLAGEIGHLVPSGIFGINGSLDLTAQVAGAQAVAVQVLDTGIIAVLFNDGTNTYIVEYTAQGAVYTGFAVGTGHIFTLPNYTNSVSMTIDEQGRFLISGADDGSSLPWIARVKADGSGVDSTFTFIDGPSWTTSGQINQLVTQISGQIIAVGYNGINGMIARYNLNGSIDHTFAAAGYLIFDGSASGTKIVPVSPYALQNVIINTNNNIYVAYADETPSINVIRFATSGIVDVSWNSGNPVNISYLNGSAMVTDQLRMVLDSIGDIILAVPSGSPTVIKAASITAASGATGTFATITMTGDVFGSDSYSLLNMMADSNGSVYFLGSDTTNIKMAVIRCTSAGILDPTFNNGTGVNFFWASGSAPSLYAKSNAGALAPDGQIFLAGAQFNSGVTTPYLSSLYNNQYVYQIAQFPATQEQGTVDIGFGTTSAETYPGIVSPYVGLYRNSLVQKAETVIELASGNILLGMNGYTNTQSYSSMMLVTLNPSGGLLSQTVIPNVTPGVDEFITDVLEDGSGNVYLSGYSAEGALLRKYTGLGTLLWNADFVDAGPGYQGLGVGFEGTTRALLFLGGLGNTGQINAYEVSTGTIDPTFNSASDHPGSLQTGDFGLNMGTLHNGIVGKTGNIFVAYKNTSTSNIDVACIFNSAPSVVWTHENIFTAYPSIAADDIRISFNEYGNIVVAASLGTNFLVTVLDATTGFTTPLYSSPLVVPCGGATSMVLQQVIGISNGAIVLVGYDSAGDGAMIVARVSSTGIVDVTFDSQGTIPGIASLKIGDQIADFYARVASGITVQSHTGINQGNLILAGYEQLFSNSSIPMILRLFGMPGTTLVPNFPRGANIPGQFDITYGSGGIAPTYAEGATTPAANQEVRSIRELTGIQIMTIITDNNSFISYTERLNADASIDTTYGGGLGVAIAQPVTTLASITPVPPTTTMMETVNHMVYDGAGNMLIVGSNAVYGGYLKRVLIINGAMDPLFGGATGLGGLADTTPYPIGTAYGLMTSVNACQQLTDGNIVIVGSNNGVGTIEIVNSTGLSSTIAQSNITFGTNGQYTQGVNATSVSVDASNNIYVAISYLDTDLVTKKAGILKLQYPGGTPDPTFGINGFVSSAISDIDNYDSLRLAFDDAGYIIIAASHGGSSGQVAVNRFTPAGIQDSTFNSGSQLDIAFVPSTIVTVTGLSVLHDDKILVSGYQSDSNPVNVYDFIACVTSSGELDHSFGSGSIPGLVTFQAPDGSIAQSARRLIDLNVQTDGKILLCGGDVPVTPVKEETPLTFRLYGYPNVQPVPQFKGYQVTLPSPLNQSFNPLGTPPGISSTGIISNLSQLGNVAIDTLNRPLISGVISAGGGSSLFVIARYIANNTTNPELNGSLDPNFGNDGIATSITPVIGLSGGYIAVDTLNNIYIGGITSTHQFILARLTSAGVLDSSFGTDGVTVSTVIPNLTKGGFVSIDTQNRPVVAGCTSDGYLVATRFLANGLLYSLVPGDPDPTFAGGLYASALVNSLVSGGSIVTDSQDSVYVGGMTSTSNLVVVKISNIGIPDTAYGTDGVATTGAISTNLVDGGAIALDSNDNVVIAGLNLNQQFVVGRFLVTGILDPLFNAYGAVPGTAYSRALNVLNVFGNINVDSNNNIIVGGSASAYDGSKSMIVARFNTVGNFDTILSSLGVASTGPIANLVRGGVVATDIYDNIFMGGLTDIPGFVVAEMYSGEEIFVNATNLTPQDLKTYYNGPNYTYFTNTIGVTHYIPIITNPAAAAVVLADVQARLDAFYTLYHNQPGWNPVWHAYRTLVNLEKSRIALNILYPGQTPEINGFFAALTERIVSLKYKTIAGLINQG